MHTASLTLSAATAPNLFSSLSASDVKADELIALYGIQIFYDPLSR